jgi:hypothetical protein
VSARTRKPSRVELAVYEIEHCGRGYAVKREGDVLLISHRDFAKPLQVRAARLRVGTIVAALEGYREAVGGAP